jgi:hypothetical protein
MNDHLVPPLTSHLGGLIPHHLGEMDPTHVETTEVLLSLLSQNKALSGNYQDICSFEGFAFEIKEISKWLSPVLALLLKTVYFCCKSMIK